MRDDSGGGLLFEKNFVNFQACFVLLFRFSIVERRFKFARGTRESLLNKITLKKELR